MWTVFLKILLAGLFAGAVYVVVKSLNQPEGGFKGWIDETVTAWKNDELSTEEFDVTHEEVGLGEVFASFEDPGESYITPEEITKSFEDMTNPEVTKKVLDSADVAVEKVAKATAIGVQKVKESKVSQTTVRQVQKVKETAAHMAERRAAERRATERRAAEAAAAEKKKAEIAARKALPGPRHVLDRRSSGPRMSA